MTLLKGILYSLAHVSMSCPFMRKASYLQHALVLFAVCVVRLLCGANVILEVGNSMLPGLQALSEELCNLNTGQCPAPYIPVKGVLLRCPPQESHPHPRICW
jgi:hypothetical protein